MRKIFTIIILAHLSIDCLAQTQGWVESKQMQVPRSRMASVAAGGKVYLAGGVANGNPYNSIDVYDTLTGTITSLGKNLRLGRADLVAVYNKASNKIFFAGGNTSGGKTTAIEVWDISANNWATELALPKATAYMCAASWGSKVLFAGGANNTTYFDDLYVYDASGGSPRTYHLSEPRDQIAIAVIDSLVIMAGGHKGSGVYSDNIDIFNLKTEEFLAHNLTLSGERAFLAGASSGNRAYFGGGKIASNTGTKVVDVIDLSGNPTYVGQMLLSKERYYFSATSVGSKVFFGGGGQESPPHYTNVDIFDVSGGSLPANPTLTEHLSVGRMPITAVTVGRKAVFAGGNTTTSSSYSDVVDIYDTNIIRPTILSLSPLDGAINVSYATNLVITFSEYIKKGTGNITVKVNDVALPAIAVSSPSVTVVDNNKLNIVVNGITTNSAITVEMAATAVKDVDGNNYIALPDVWNFTTGKVVTASLNSPADFEVDSDADIKVSMTVNDPAKLNGTIPQFWSRGISDDPADIELSTHIPVPNSNIYEVTLSSEDFNDPIGLYYYFKYTDISEQSYVTEGRRIYLRYTDQNSPPILYTSGNQKEDYRIISIPLKLAQNDVLNVFGALAPYDKKRWRVYDYFGDDNREYTGSSNSFTKIEHGKGYWLLTTFEGDIKPGAGTTVPFDDEVNNVPFGIVIQPGWNLIGNPYNFDISWNDVLDENDASDVAQIGTDVQIYSGGNDLAAGDVIDRYRGAFVLSGKSQAVTLKIPVKKNTSINGRVNSTAEVDLSSYNWTLPLKLTDGNLTNSTGGIGMNKNATLSGLDKFDRVQAPIPNGIGMFKMEFAHPELEFNFVKEVVPTSVSHIWDLSLVKTSDKVLTLTWDQASFKETDNQLFLVDASFGSVKNMKAEASYTVPSSTNNLKIIFGNSDFILESLDKLLPVAGFPYPNPATSEVHIPFHVPSKAGSLDVKIEVFNSQGMKVATLANATYEKGDHEVIWSTWGKSGLYIVETNIANRHTRTKVVVK